MRRGLIGLVLLVAVTGCTLPSTAPLGGGQAWLCEYVRQAVADGVMTYEYASYYYPQCQPLPGRTTGA